MKRNVKKTIEERRRKDAESRFVNLLDRAIEAAYEAGIENRGDVLTLPIKELHYRLVFKVGGTPRTAGA